MTTLTEHNTRLVADTIRTQIGINGLMTLGAHSVFSTVVDGNPGLTFKARIAGFRANGHRGTAPRNMRVWITLTPADLYRVHVGYEARGGGWTTHYEADGIRADQLADLALALDYDGPTVLNPRYF